MSINQHTLTIKLVGHSWKPEKWKFRKKIKPQILLFTLINRMIYQTTAFDIINLIFCLKIIFSATRLCDSDNESCSDLTTCGSRRRRDILRWGMTHENSNVYTMTSGPIKIVKNNWGLFLVYKTFEQKLKILDKPQWNRLEISVKT